MYGFKEAMLMTGRMAAFMMIGQVACGGIDAERLALHIVSPFEGYTVAVVAEEGGQAIRGIEIMCCLCTRQTSTP